MRVRLQLPKKLERSVNEVLHSERKEHSIAQESNQILVTKWHLPKEESSAENDYRTPSVFSHVPVDEETAFEFTARTSHLHRIFSLYVCPTVFSQPPTLRCIYRTAPNRFFVFRCRRSKYNAMQNQTWL